MTTRLILQKLNKSSELIRRNNPKGIAEQEIKQLPTQKQLDSIATAEKIMRIFGNDTERREKRRISPEGILKVTSTVETPPIMLQPEFMNTRGSHDCATINCHTVSRYQLGRVARAAGSLDPGNQTPLSSWTEWHIRLGIAAQGLPIKPGDMVEESKGIAPPVISGADEAVNLADPDKAARLDSFVSYVDRVDRALPLHMHILGMTAELSANIAA